MSTLKDNATQLAGALTEDLFNILSGNGLPMVMDWVATLLEAAQTGGIQGAIEAANGILSNLLNTFFDNLPQMMDAGVGMIASLLQGFAGSGAVGKIMAGIATILRAFVNAIANHLPEILSAGVSILMQLLAGIGQMVPTLLTYAGELILRLFNAFVNADWASIGHNIVAGIQNGIAGLWDSLVSQVQEAVNNLWQSAKNALGIASPSKKFKYIGEMSVEGIEEGFEDKEQELNRTVNTVYNGMVQATGGSAVPGAGSLESGISYNLAATGGSYTIVVPLFLDGREIARATAWSMGQQLAWEEI